MNRSVNMSERKINTPIDLAGIRLESRVMNGAGPVKLPEDVLEVAKSDSAAIVVGSITVEQREGNKGKTLFIKGCHTLNSIGMRNGGIAYYEKHLPEMVQIAHDHNKPLIVSVAGFSPQEYARLAESVLNCGVDGIELNEGCPNVWGEDGKQKHIASFDEDLTGEITRKVEESVGLEAWVAVKLSPFSDPFALKAIASVLSSSGLVKVVTSTNTFPNAYDFDNEEPVIDPADGLAGMSGPALRPIGLGQVKQLRAILPPRIAVIGVGGISMAQDVEDYLDDRVGACAVQVTTAYINFGSSIFTQLRGV